MENTFDLEKIYIANKKVFILLVATEYRITLHNLLQTIKKQGYSYIISKYKQPWKGWRTKWEGFIESAQYVRNTFGDDTFCIALDAYDTAVIRPAEEFVKEYSNYLLKNPQTQFVCGLEDLCHPTNCGYIESYWEDKNINSGVLQKRYLNAGCVISNAKFMEDMYKWISKKSLETDDQKALASFVIQHTMQGEMDFYSKFIKNKKFNECLTEKEKVGQGAFFLHFPGPSSYTMQHTRALEMFGGPLVINSPDYNYLGKKCLAGIFAHRHILYLLLIFIYIFLF